MILPWFSEFHISFPIFHEYPITHHQTIWFMMMGVWWETSVSYKNDLVLHSQFHHVKPYHPMIYPSWPMIKPTMTKTHKNPSPKDAKTVVKELSTQQLLEVQSGAFIYAGPKASDETRRSDVVGTGETTPCPPKHCLGDTFIIYV